MNSRGALLLLSLALAAGCAPRPLLPPPASDRALTLAFSASLLGTLEPGGCRTDLRGGLRAVQQAIERRRAAGPLFWFDAGDLFAPAAANDRAKARRFLRQVQKQPPQALVPGESDLGLGCDFLRDSHLPWLISNYRTRSPAAAPLFPPRLQLEHRGLRLLVSGWIDPTAGMQEVAAAHTCLAPQPESDAAALEALGQGLPPADLHLVLLHGGREFAARLARRLPTPAIIFAAHGGELTSEVERVQHSLYLEAGSFGRELLLLQLRLPPAPLRGFVPEGAPAAAGEARYRFEIIALPEPR